MNTVVFCWPQGNPPNADKFEKYFKKGVTNSKEQYTLYLRPMRDTGYSKLI